MADPLNYIEENITHTQFLELISEKGLLKDFDLLSDFDFDS
jgi:hypothetical protein